MRRRRAIGVSAVAVLVALTTYSGIEWREHSREEAERAERAVAAAHQAACTAFELEQAAIRRDFDQKLSYAQTDMERAVVRAQFHPLLEAVKARATKVGCLPATVNKPVPRIARQSTPPEPLPGDADDLF
jgi:hypothetical protein